MAESRLEERIKDSKIRWYFTKEEVENSPSRAHGVDPHKELSYRQQAANMIEDMGQRLNVNQLCINTAIVYMHRFYMVHSFKTFHRTHVATAALFLAAKVEEQPRKLEYVAKVSFSCQNRDAPMLDTQSETYTKLIEEITYHELLILETLGFEVAVEHPHPHVVNCMHLVRASKDLSQTAYFMAHNSLLLTTFCLQHRPTIVACVCIHLACRWKGLEIPLSADNKNWWEYIDPEITLDQLNVLTKEFLMIYEKCPSRLQKKITEPMRVAQQQGKSDQSSSSSSSSHPPQVPNKGKSSSSHKHKVSSQPPPQPSSGQKHHHSQQQQSAHKVHHHSKHSSKPQESHPKSHGEHTKQSLVVKSQSSSVKVEYSHLRPPQLSNTDRSGSTSPRPQFAKLPSKSQGGGWKQTEHHPLHGHSSKTMGTTEQRRQRQTDSNHDTHRHHREDHRKRPHGGDVPETKRTKLDPPLPPPLPPTVDCSMPPLPPLPASPPPPPPPATTSHHHVPPFLPRGSNVTLPPLPLAFPWGSPPQPL